MPTIIEAARALYNGHTVADIAKNDAEENLAVTTKAISQIIEGSKERQEKSICFVTGVPGAGKTLIGLNVATAHIKESSAPVFLSGNGPLVRILQEALVRDKVAFEKERGRKMRKGEP